MHLPRKTHNLPIAQPRLDEDTELNARRFFCGALLFLGLCAPAAAQAQPLVVFSTVAAKGALEVIAPEFERAHGRPVRLRFGTAAELKTDIERGAPFDVALLTTAATDDLIKQDRLAATSKTLVFQSGVGAAVRPGASTNRIDTAEELKALLLAVKSVALSTQGASGPIVRRAFERLGIADVMAPKVVLISDMTAPEAVARGRADVGFTQISEILDTPDALLLGPLPGDLQSLSSFSAATAAGTSEPALSALFVKVLTLPAAQGHMRSRGLIPKLATDADPTGMGR